MDFGNFREVSVNIGLDRKFKTFLMPSENTGAFRQR